MRRLIFVGFVFLILTTRLSGAELFSGLDSVVVTPPNNEGIGTITLSGNWLDTSLRNLERCITWEGIIPRKRRKSFEQFLDHKDARIRARAEEILEQDRAERAYQHYVRELDEALSEKELSDIGCSQGDEEGSGRTGERDDRRWTAIPF